MEALVNVRKYLLSGVSFAIPFIACGGILIALGLAFSPMLQGSGPDTKHAPQWAQFCLLVGGTAFDLMPVVLAGYIAYAMAGKPSLVAGMVGGWVATHLGDVTVATGDVKQATSGFLGAMIAGLLAGYLVMAMKAIPVHKYVKPIMPIMVIPIVSALSISAVMLYVIGHPIAEAMTAMNHWLQQMQSGSAVVLAMILGAMIAFDMGGPVNKVAFFFGAALIKEGNVAVMGSVAAAICTPPIGLGLATFIARKLWTEEEREAGIAAFAMGFIGITEGAIPFAAGDPLRVIPCIMVGSMTAATVAMLGHVGDHAPHGGPIVMFVVDSKLMYAVAIAAGVAVTAVAINIVKSLTSKRPGPAEVAA